MFLEGARRRWEDVCFCITPPPTPRSSFSLDTSRYHDHSNQILLCEAPPVSTAPPRKAAGECVRVGVCLRVFACAPEPSEASSDRHAEITVITPDSGATWRSSHMSFHLRRVLRGDRLQPSGQADGWWSGNRGGGNVRRMGRGGRCEHRESTGTCVGEKKLMTLAA